MHLLGIACIAFHDNKNPVASAAAIIDANPGLSDSKIMLTHYSAEQLFSAAKRRQFIEPDLDPISRHEQ